MTLHHFVLAVLGVLPWSCEGKAALLIVDVQQCFLPVHAGQAKKGSLDITNAHLIIPTINKMIAKKSCLFDEVIFTQDYHPKDHISFGTTHGLAPFSHIGTKGGLPIMCIKPKSGLAKDSACCPTQYIDASKVNCTTQLCTPDGWNYTVNKSSIVSTNAACTTCKKSPDECYATTQAMWTDHCLQSGDSDISANLTRKSTDVVVKKGMNQFVDAYSAFADNTKSVKTELDDELKTRKIDTLYIVGLATDVCVEATVIDGLTTTLTKGYKITVITDATEAVQANAANKAAAEKKMKEKGATLKTSTEILAMTCPAGAGAGAATNNSSTTAKPNSTNEAAGAIRQACAYAFVHFIVALCCCRAVWL